MTISKSKKNIFFKNTVYVAMAYFITTILSFVSRFYFLRELGAINLGINAVFTSYISVLSIVDLGMDAVFSFSLYTPLRNKDYLKLKQNLMLFKHMYTVIAIVILLIGLISLPFLKAIVGAQGAAQSDIYAVFIILILNTSFSYLMVYNKSLLIADQYSYVVSNISSVVKIITVILQIVILIFTKNFILYTLLLLLSTIVTNLILYKYVNVKYKHIVTQEYNQPLEKSEKKIIYKNILGGLSNKIGTILVSSSDNIILANLVSTISVSVYSNYVIIISAISTLIVTISQALTPSLGSIDPTKKAELAKAFTVAYKLAFYGLILVVPTLLVSLNPFIKLWLGHNFVLQGVTTTLIVINFILLIYRIPALMFIDALGLQWVQRWKSIVEGLVNIIVGIICVLVFKLGISGVLIGTLVSNLLVVSWYEPFVVVRKKISTIKLRNLFGKMFISLIVLCAICTIMYKITGSINLNNEYVTFVVNLLVSLGISCIFIIIFLLFDKDIRHKILKRK